MKKILILFAAILLCIPVVKAQSGFGVKAGMNFNTMSDLKGPSGDFTVKSRTGFHMGVLYKAKLPLGFAIQPELLYISKNSRLGYSEFSNNSYIGIDKELKMHYFQLPVGLQWGVDLVLFRPYLQFVPYIGYAIAKGGLYEDVKWNNVNRFEYGIGFGAGLEVWKFQLSGRYSWDLGKVKDFNWNSVNIKNGKNKGFELSLALIF